VGRPGEHPPGVAETGLLGDVRSAEHLAAAADANAPAERPPAAGDAGAPGEGHQPAHRGPATRAVPSASRQPLPVPAIETVGLRKEYGRKVALHDLSLMVQTGEVFGLLGPNGAGKTTTVKILTGLVRPTAGEARLFGQPAADPAARRRIGYLPESFRFHDWLTGEALLDFHGRLAGLSVEERRQRIPQVIERVGLAGRGGERLRAYSKGMTQRIGLAQAILHRPDLVLLDEPTSALDPVGRREVRDLVRGLRAEGIAVLLNSHLLTEIEMVCDRVAIVDRGRVVREGRLADLVGGTSEVRLTLDRVDAELLEALRAHGEVLTVEGKGPDLARPTARASSAFPPDHSAEPQLIPPDRAGATVVLGVPDLEVAPTIAETVVRRGYRLYGLVPIQRSLEDVFVSLVEGRDA
jgi:ABC-2 type transport system ATP-binding protein